MTAEAQATVLQLLMWMIHFLHISEIMSCMFAVLEQMHARQSCSVHDNEGEVLLAVADEEQA